MTSLAPFDLPASDLALAPRARLTARLASSIHKPAVRTALWVATVIAEALALRPVLFDTPAPIQPISVIFTLVGGSFAACGLIAWRRRPDSRKDLAFRLTAMRQLRQRIDDGHPAGAVDAGDNPKHDQRSIRQGDEGRMVLEARLDDAIDLRPLLHQLCRAAQHVAPGMPILRTLAPPARCAAS